MAIEIERKFLVRNDRWRSIATQSVALRQGYLCVARSPSEAEVRVRCKPNQAFLTIKGAGDLVRTEFEYEIPRDDAAIILGALCSGRAIAKIRHTVPLRNVTWEVDEYLDAHAGLFIAEVELTNPDEPLTLPDWVGREVTSDSRFRNAELACDSTSWRLAST